MKFDLYRGMRSVVAENESVRVKIVPELGAKLVSLLYKPSGKEWLLDSGSRPLIRPVYGSAFTSWDMSGWDECFPTIDACTLGTGGGASLPDHGEVWALPWDCEITGERAVCSVKGIAFPYRLTRTLCLTENGRVRLEYEAVNLGDEPMPFLWAAHPQFRVDGPTRILIPGDMSPLKCVYGGLSRTTEGLYPASEIDLVHPETTGDGTKFYYPGTVPQGWSGLYCENSGNYLLLRVPAETVPHWGVWIDKGMFNDRTAIALEPGIGYYDSLARAEANGTAVVLDPGRPYRWHVEIVLGQGDWKRALQP